MAMTPCTELDFILSEKLHSLAGVKQMDPITKDTSFMRIFGEIAAQYYHCILGAKFRDIFVSTDFCEIRAEHGALKEPRGYPAEKPYIIYDSIADMIKRFSIISSSADKGTLTYGLYDSLEHYKDKFYGLTGRNKEFMLTGAAFLNGLIEYSAAYLRFLEYILVNEKGCASDETHKYAISIIVQIISLREDCNSEILSGADPEHESIKITFDSPTLKEVDRFFSTED